VRTTLVRGSLVAAGLGLAATTLTASPANAATVIQVRPGDLIQPPGTVSGTTGTAKADFLAEGIHIKTTNNTDAARGYWKVGVPLAQVHTVDYEWFGSRATTPPSNVGEPGIYYNIDIDGDGKADGQLIGELAYGGKDVWLNRDAEDFSGVTPTVPAGTFNTLSPCNPTTNTAQNGNQDGCTPPNGAGDPRHGTLDDWNRSIAASGRTATLVSAGYIANGFVYDGVLRSATFGPNQYVFTNAAKTKVDVTANAKRPQVKKGNDVVIKGTATPVGVGAEVTLELKTKNGTWKAVQTKVLDASGSFKLKGKAGQVGNAKYRVTVSETNSTAAATSNKVKVHIVES
jgi:hypothetical protein